MFLFGYMTFVLFVFLVGWWQHFGHLVYPHTHNVNKWLHLLAIWIVHYPIARSWITSSDYHGVQQAIVQPVCCIAMQENHFNATKPQMQSRDHVCQPLAQLTTRHPGKSITPRMVSLLWAMVLGCK